MKDDKHLSFIRDVPWMCISGIMVASSSKWKHEMRRLVSKSYVPTEITCDKD
uniref:Uncharacterized protein n=1 Tax=Manihot esculenta TaxID=3983 RepID=A0A2C9V6L1_MANES